ncbi:hypothetical protein KIH39_15795 [Telmatocola sphagniphila]|uniref:UvrD-like helicase C-terminal domain-containing protein n=1 Tax=Telmatocola sphagniphila TaxID=1123043 RepID=A0A8E6B1J8_9BACT|nr:hypothetical protein KIH39_15795 [Telmatocola sphagniphila]
MFSWNLSAISLKGLATPTTVPKPKKLTSASEIANVTIPFKSQQISARSISIETVHAVKGETHDISIFVCPDRTNTANCPSQIWWSNNTKDREARRIAYVAMTRSRSDLILFVPVKCKESFETNRSNFAESFQTMTTDEAISLYTNK